MAPTSQTTSSCWATLNLPQNCDEAAIKASYRKLAKAQHPDVGGSEESMTQLNAARGEALDRCRRPWMYPAPTPPVAPTTHTPDQPASQPTNAGPSPAAHYEETLSAEDEADRTNAAPEQPADDRPIWKRLLVHIASNLITLAAILLVGAFGLHYTAGTPKWLIEVAPSLPADWRGDPAMTILMVSIMILTALALALLGPSRNWETRILRITLSLPVMALATWSGWLAILVAVLITISIASAVGPSESA